MPIVIDANCANALASANCASSKRILEWVRSRGTVVSGGHLQRELGRTRLSDLIAAWARAGRLQILGDDQLEGELTRVIPLAESNDAHVIAVVVVGDASVVLTGDQALMRDLKNPAVARRKRKIISHGENGFSRDRIVQSLLRNC